MNQNEKEDYVVFIGKSIEEAKAEALSYYEMPEEQISFEILSDVKKGIFGRVKEYAKVRARRIIEGEEGITVTAHGHAAILLKEPEESDFIEKMAVCETYIKDILKCMNIESEIVMEHNDDTIFIDIKSNGSGAVIGRRGETLDALQYLTSLVANKGDGAYIRIAIDSCGYREKRVVTLEALAERIGHKVLKSGKPTVLEPMNPYERRIIHSTIAKMEGIGSRSIGDEPYRKVIVTSNTPKKIPTPRKKNYSNRNKHKDYSSCTLDLKTTFEKDYKKPKPEDDINAGLYGKIEL